MELKDSNYNENRIDSEKGQVEEIVHKLEDYWLDNGYVEDIDPENEALKNPFQMISILRKADEEETQRALDIFEEKLIEDPRASRYWTSSDGIEKILQYSTWNHKGKAVGAVNNMMQGYISTSQVRGKAKAEALREYSQSINTYFIKRGYEDLDLWSKEENAMQLYKYYSTGRKEPLEIIKEEHDLRVSTDEENAHYYPIKEAYEDFLDMWEVLEIPGFLNNKYLQMRESFINKMEDPEPLQRLGDTVIKKRRQYPTLTMLNAISKIAKDDDSDNQKIAKKFINNIVLDPKLYVFAETLRRYEEDLKEKHKDDRGYLMGGSSYLAKKDPLKLEIKYEDLLKGLSDNENSSDLEWMKREGFEILGEIFEKYPYLYMDIAKDYIQRYIEMSAKDPNKEDLKEIIHTLFPGNNEGALRKIFPSRNYGGSFIRIFSKINRNYISLKKAGYAKYEKSLKGRSHWGKQFQGLGKVEGRVKTEGLKIVKAGGPLSFLFGKDFDQKLLEENIEYFSSTKAWVEYWKKAARSLSLGKLFKEDIETFNKVIDTLEESTGSNTKNYNYFDGIRMMNILAKRMSEVNKFGVHTEKDTIGGERSETERKILLNVKELVTQKPITITSKYSEQDPRFSEELLREYLNKYNLFVEGFENEFTLNYGEDFVEIFYEFASPEFITALKSLGLEIIIDKNKAVINNLKDLDQRLLGILLTPTLFEWAEDDKMNKNPQNEKLRTLFFLPSNVKIVTDKDSDELFSFSNHQDKVFRQRYLPWYIQSKLLTGDDRSLNVVLSAWLSENDSLKRDLYKQSESIREKMSRVWKDTIDSLALVFENERLNRTNNLERFLRATNIQEIPPLISNDRYQVAVLAASLMYSALESAQNARMLKAVSKTNSTYRNTFGGEAIQREAYEEEVEEVKGKLRSLGFTDVDDTLQMFRDFWTNTWHLRGDRDLKQNIEIGFDGIWISNPGNNMYKLEEKKEKNSKGEMESTFKHKHGGGPDKVFVSWGQILEVSNYELDYIPVKDLLIDVFNAWASFWNYKAQPKIVRKIEEEGPANIILKLKGREEPLVEFASIKKPKAFWSLLQTFAKLMAEEDGAKNVADLIRVLESSI